MYVCIFYFSVCTDMNLLLSVTLLFTLNQSANTNINILFWMVCTVCQMWLTIYNTLKYFEIL